MLLDIFCFDERPRSIDLSSSYVGPECEDTLGGALSVSMDQPTLVCFGRTSQGQSLCVSLTEYKPWTRLMCLKACYTEMEMKQQETSLKALVVQYLGLGYAQVQVRLELMPKFYGFDCDTRDPKSPKQNVCFKISLPSFGFVAKLENIWRYKDESKSPSLKNRFKESFVLTDSMTPNAVKALNELGYGMSGWLHLSSYKVSSNRISTCSLDLEASITQTRALPEKVQVAPLKLISFDAEMYSHDNGFPEVLHGDMTVAICATIQVYGQPDASRNVAFVVWPVDLKGPLPTNTPNLKVHYCASSLDLMEQFRDFVALEDPDLLTGWNIYGFDMPFLWDEYQSAHMLSKLRGSEELHSQLVQALGRGPLKTVSDLLKLAKASKKQVDLKDFKLSQKNQKELHNASKLPEAVAHPIRLYLRTLLCLPAEPSFGGLEDLERLRAFAKEGHRSKERTGHLFQQVIDKPRIVGLQRGQFLSRFVGERSFLDEKRMASAAKGDNLYYYWSGRCCVDLMQIIKDDKKLEDNTLKFTAQTYLDPEYGKIDMNPAELFRAFREQDPKQMARMIDYCVRDAEIPILLIDKLSYVPLWVEMSRVTYTGLHSVLNGGQQRKVYNLIAHFVHNRYALNLADSEWPVADEHEFDLDEPPIVISTANKRPDYQGATVIEPLVGFYNEPVSTLDFESLYPSIMIHFNLCPSVYVKPSSLGPTRNVLRAFGLEDSLEVHTIDHNVANAAGLYDEFAQTYGFVKHVQGIIPSLLQHLLKARKVAKRAMASATNEFEQSVQNGRQLALKVSCNSVYGFFGVNPKKGLMSCKPIAAVTTLKGRAFIEASKVYVESHYGQSKVLYGDTDSIMIHWGPGIDVPRAYQLAEEASASITELLRSGHVPGATRPLLDTAKSAVTLANEKVYWPYLLIQKKNYAGFKYTVRPKQSGPLTMDSFDTCIDMKGIDAVRRDRTKLIKEMSSAVLDALLVKRSLDLALNTLQDCLNLVVQNKAPLDWFVMSKSLKSSYKTENQPHVQAWKRMIGRNETDIPEIGTRMPYVIVRSKGSKSGPLYERTEHPAYVKAHNISVCAKYYLENARDVLERLLGPTGQAHKVKSMFEQALLDAEHKASGNQSLLHFFKRPKLG